MACALCDSKKATRQARIEGVILRVCDECIKFGEEVAKVEYRPIKKQVRMPQEMEETAVENFSDIIRKQRQKNNLTQEQLAKKLKEKHSIIKRIEEGWKPPLSVLRKLEKFFNVKLLETAIAGKITTKKSGKKLTLGDIVEIS